MSRRPNPDPPRTHWVLLSVLMVMLLAAMLISAIASGQVGEGARSPASRGARGWVPETIRGGGPVIEANHPDRAGLSVPAKHVVLTFDDGPTPWTADILDVLRKHGVPATFFVVGARAADRPDLMRRMYGEGHEVGVHTFSHVNLANVSSRRQRVELDQTQLAIAAATGHTTNLLRAPYSSQVANADALGMAGHPGGRNYRVVYTDLDTRDWDGPGSTPSSRAGLPAGDRGRSRDDA